MQQPVSYDIKHNVSNISYETAVSNSSNETAHFMLICTWPTLQQLLPGSSFYSTKLNIKTKLKILFYATFILIRFLVLIKAQKCRVKLRQFLNTLSNGCR